MNKHRGKTYYISIFTVFFLVSAGYCAGLARAQSAGSAQSGEIESGALIDGTEAENEDLGTALLRGTYDVGNPDPDNSTLDGEPTASTRTRTASLGSSSGSSTGLTGGGALGSDAL